MSSRLFQSIREERGLAYSVYAYRMAFEGGGDVAVYAGTSPAHAAEVLDLIDAEFERVAKGVTAAELETARATSGGDGPGPRGLRGPHEPDRAQPDRARAGADPRRGRGPTGGLTLDRVNEVAGPVAVRGPDRTAASRYRRGGATTGERC